MKLNINTNTMNLKKLLSNQALRCLIMVMNQSESNNQIFIYLM